MNFKFDLQLFGGVVDSIFGGGETKSTSSYEMSPQQKELANMAIAKANNASGTVDTLQNAFNSAVNTDYFNGILGTGNSMVASGQNAISNAANGIVPTEYMDNFTQSLKKATNASVGSAVNSLASRGVVNSSVSNKALDDISANVSNTVASNYGNMLNQASQLGSNQINAATAGYAPYSALQGLGANYYNTYIASPLGAMSGTGTTTQTVDDGSTGLGNLVQMGLGAYVGGLGAKWAK